MESIKIGMQLHSVREAFGENPVETLKKVKGMGYTGVEFVLAPGTVPSLEKAIVYKSALAETGLECYGVLVSWEHVQPNKLQDLIVYNQMLGNDFIIIGDVSVDYIDTIEKVREVVSYMNEIQKVLHHHGMTTGFHNHAFDFIHVVDGKTFFEHVFENTDADFAMILDTGNAMDGGCDSIELLKKYPGRSRVLHIKGYSKEKKYLAYIGQDDFDWDAVIRCAIENGGSRILNVEFGQRGDYDPFERAQVSFDVVDRIVKGIN